MRKWIATSGILAVLWLFIRGPEPDKILGELLIGLVIAFGISYSLRNMYDGEIDLKHWAKTVPLTVLYIWDFLKELLTANIDLTKRVLSPSVPMSPQVIEVPLRIESGAAITVLANSITLTPGTLTMDYSSEKNSLYVHAINGNTEKDEVLETITNWEDMLIKIFDEETVEVAQ